ncbi:LOG family protein [Candidatus Bathyarchaeota archaeon]|nr:LOG family protein [Candidatus Bathyarchaeota archaeon]
MAESLDREFGEKHFRVAIFGSARIEKDDSVYNEVYSLARLISEAGIDLVTGGGPGLMDAASAGHHAGRTDDKAHSVGLRIRLPTEESEATHLDVKKEFNLFSNRLESFMRLSKAVVVAPGGVGTLLELFYTWQLLQVKKITRVPIILFGEMWVDLLRWIRKWPLESKLISPEDLDLLFIAKNYREAFEIIREAHQQFFKGNQEFCTVYKKFKA